MMSDLGFEMPKLPDEASLLKYQLFQLFSHVILYFYYYLFLFF